MNIAYDSCLFLMLCKRNFKQADGRRANCNKKISHCYSVSPAMTSTNTSKEMNERRFIGQKFALDSFFLQQQHECLERKIGWCGIQKPNFAPLISLFSCNPQVTLMQERKSGAQRKMTRVTCSSPDLSPLGSSCSSDLPLLGPFASIIHH